MVWQRAPIVMMRVFRQAHFLPAVTMVAVLVAVPGEVFVYPKFAAEGEGVGEGREAVGEVRAVLEVFEEGLRRPPETDSVSSTVATRPPPGQQVHP